MDSVRSRRSVPPCRMVGSRSDCQRLRPEAVRKSLTTLSAANTDGTGSSVPVHKISMYPPRVLASPVGSPDLRRLNSERRSPRGPVCDLILTGGGRFSPSRNRLVVGKAERASLREALRVGMVNLTLVSIGVLLYGCQSPGCHRFRGNFGGFRAVAGVKDRFRLAPERREGCRYNGRAFPG